MIVGNGQEQEIEHSLGRKPKLVFAFAVNTSTFSNSERYQIIEGTHDAKVVRFTVYNGPGPFYRVVAFA